MLTIGNHTEPGGYLQWDEYDSGTTGVVGSTPDAPTQLLNAMLQAMGSNRPLRLVVQSGGLTLF
jgi:hypothetical protein